MKENKFTLLKSGDISKIIVLLYTCLLAVSIFLKKDLLLISNVLVLLLVASIYLVNHYVVTLYSYVIMSLISRGLVELGFPSLIIYVTDYLIVILFIALFMRIFNNRNEIKVDKTLFVILAGIIIVNIFGWLANSYNFYSFLWGIRNNYRYIVFILSIIYLPIKESDIRKIVKIVVSLAFCIVPLTIFQYSLGWTQDRISGIFGFGGTGIMGQFIFIVIAIYTVKYNFKRISLIRYILIIALLMIPSIVAEVKISFVMLPIVCIVGLVRKLNIKKIVSLGIILCMTIYTFNIFAKLYPGFSDIFEFNNLKKYSTEAYGDSESLGRISSISYVYNNFLKEDSKKLIGIGLGNASPNKYEILQSDFYKENSNLKYEWMFIPYYLLENGVIGFVTFLILLVFCYRTSTKLALIDESRSELALIAKINIVVSIIILFYNNSIILEQYGTIFWLFNALVIKQYVRVRGENNDSSKFYYNC